MNKYVEYVLKELEEQKIFLTNKEKENIEIADFGLNDFEKFGLGLYTYINNDYYCAKELVMLPNQICPEHRHPPFDDYLGKLETFRCRKGTVTLYVESKDNKLKTYDKDAIYTCDKKVVLLPGEQYTIPRNTKHWFQAGPNGAIISEFSTMSVDEKDIFTDKNIRRTP